MNLIESFGWKSFTILYEDNQVDTYGDGDSGENADHDDVHVHVEDHVDDHDHDEVNDDDPGIDGKGNQLQKDALHSLLAFPLGG